MRHENGWVKLHRKLNKSWISQDAATLAIFDTLLRWASFGENKMFFNGSLINLKPGTIITSTRDICDQLKLNRRTVERRLNLLETDKTIVLKRSNRGTMISIVNWESYQGDEDEEVQQKDNRRAAVVHSVRPKCTTDRHLNKKLRNKELRINIAEDCASTTPADEKTVKKKKPKKEISDHIKDLRSKTRAIYFLGYEKTMGVKCPTNAKVNSMLAKLVDYLGPDAPNVAGYYFRFGRTIGGRFFGERGFNVDLLLKDYQTIYAAYQQAVQKGSVKADFYKDLLGT